VQHEVARVRAEPTFRIGTGELAYVRVAAFVAERLPPNALLLSMQHSGSLRYYAGRLTMRYDWLAPDWWPRALEVLTVRGYRPFIVLEEWEEPLFRRRFDGGGDSPGCLVARDEGPGRTRIYDPLRGPWCGPVRIEPVRDACRPPR
jgi:hypothetical protein